MSRHVDIFTDGGCSGNPGPAGIGVVIKENGQTVREISKSIGPATNNVAEYAALICGLQEALIMRVDTLTAHVDSELLFNHLQGSYKVKHENIQPLFVQVKHLLSGFRRADLKRIPRELNSEADKLAKKAIKEQTKVVASKQLTFGEESPSSNG